MNGVENMWLVNQVGLLTKEFGGGAGFTPLGSVADFAKDFTPPSGGCGGEWLPTNGAWCPRNAYQDYAYGVSPQNNLKTATKCAFFGADGVTPYGQLRIKVAGAWFLSQDRQGVFLPTIDPNSWRLSPLTLLADEVIVGVASDGDATFKAMVMAPDQSLKFFTGSGVSPTPGVVTWTELVYPGMPILTAGDSSGIMVLGTTFYFLSSTNSDDLLGIWMWEAGSAPATAPAPVGHDPVDSNWPYMRGKLLPKFLPGTPYLSPITLSKQPVGGILGDGRRPYTLSRGLTLLDAPSGRLLLLVTGEDVDDWPWSEPETPRIFVLPYIYGNGPDQRWADAMLFQDNKGGRYLEPQASEPVPIYVQGGDGGATAGPQIGTCWVVEYEVIGGTLAFGNPEIHAFQTGNVSGRTPIIQVAVASARYMPPTNDYPMKSFIAARFGNEGAPWAVISDSQMEVGKCVPKNIVNSLWGDTYVHLSPELESVEEKDFVVRLVFERDGEFRVPLSVAPEGLIRKIAVGLAQFPPPGPDDNDGPGGT